MKPARNGEDIVDAARAAGITGKPCRNCGRGPARERLGDEYWCEDCAPEERRRREEQRLEDGLRQLEETYVERVWEEGLEWHYALAPREAVEQMRRRAEERDSTATIDPAKVLWPSFGREFVIHGSTEGYESESEARRGLGELKRQLVAEGLK